jgi:hypothetical protein
MPQYGEKIRPLPRTFDGNEISAIPLGQVETFTDEDGCTIKVELWFNLVRPDVKAGPENETFTIALIHDPNYDDPLLVAFSLDLSVEAVHSMYKDRWPVEQIPLAAKHMVGDDRQFVSAAESCQRLPAIPTGFWDRELKRTPGRLRRALEGVPFSESYPIPHQIREKASVTEHLPKGILGHRRRARA